MAHKTGRGPTMHHHLYANIRYMQGGYCGWWCVIERRPVEIPNGAFEI